SPISEVDIGSSPSTCSVHVPTVLIYTELMPQVQHQGPSQFEIRLVVLAVIQVSPLERPSESPVQSARPQVASPPTCSRFPSSSLMPEKLGIVSQHTYEFLCTI
ncbi:hypothetical protein Tco_0274314, partial [Tanacetum coccineum]